jgi:hypothetical protein
VALAIAWSATICSLNLRWLAADSNVISSSTGSTMSVRYGFPGPITTTLEIMLGESVLSDSSRVLHFCFLRTTETRK